MKTNKMIKDLYLKLSNNLEYTDLLVDAKTINKMVKYHQNNFEKFDNYNDYIEDLGDLKIFFDICPAVKNEIEKQFTAQKGLQPAILTECVISQTIANIYGLNSFGEFRGDEPLDIKAAIAGRVMKAGSLVASGSPRYVYYDEKKSTLLFQYGDSSSVDAALVKGNDVVKIEYKESSSKLEEIDIHGAYDEKGLLIISDDFRSKNAFYVKYLEMFNEETNMFALAGHNYKIFKHMDENDLKDITEAVFNNKNVSLYVFQKRNKIYAVLPEYLIDNVSFQGSEIRTAGRNARNVFTKEYADKIILENGGYIEGSQITMPFKEKSYVSGRTKSKSNKSRYKLNSLLFVKSENIFKVGESIKFDYSKLKQLVPTISPHLDLKLDLEKQKESLEKMKDLKFK